ncbi:MAG TPA: hypothetical protein VJ867_06935 [Gemmatimonadaceae bacterium]|nr:hypothetical protein [Gemmatimonadaceae bacterium]
MSLVACALLLQIGVGPVHRDAESVTAIVARARAARYQQDSALASYQAMARQRMSAGIGVAPGLRGGLAAVGRVRLAARYESVARVGWDHERGAWAEMIASRSVVPFLGMREPHYEGDDVALTLPYYPGRDRLWPVTELSDALHEGLRRDVVWIEHPLDPGADSLYVLTLGDSIAFRLPDHSTIQLREIRVRPRRPAQQLIVGSLWVDRETGALVRAAYRPSTPIDLWPLFEHEMDDDDRDAMRKFGPYTGSVQEIIVEHGLYEGRFWLPRTRMAVGEGTARGARMTIEIQQTFSYERVTAMPEGTFAQSTQTVADTDATGRRRRDTWREVQDRDGRCRPHGSDARRFTPDSLVGDSSLSVMYSEGVRFRVLLPCRLEDLATSPELPRSIYSSDEALFTETDFAALQRDANAALAMSRQAEWQPQKVQIAYGPRNGLLRYNRVEGLSAGAMATRVLGKGYTESALVRVGTADLQPNAEARIERSNARLTLDAVAYRRLATANDWGNPMGIGASITALLFGRDEGFYYRTAGVETRGLRQSIGGRASFAWRVFAEREDSAPIETKLSVAHAMNGVRFRPNIAATEGVWSGAALAATFTSGLDPVGLRASGKLTADAATGPTDFARGILELTMNRGVGRARTVTLTGSTGSTVGEVPVQRLFYLGGPETVHGHAPGDMVGDAFWMGHLEIAEGHAFFGTAAFVDVGWAGARTDWTRAPSTLRGAGVGIHLLQGLVRLDVSHGLEPAGRWRGDLFVDLR